MNDKDFRMLVKERKKRGLTKGVWLDLLYLLLPSFLMMVVFIVSLYSFILSFFAIYFILPMFYTVVKRIFYRVSNVGKRDFSYADGYRAFFQERKGGVFGVISTLLISLSVLLVSYLIFMNIFPSLVNLYDESRDVFKKLTEMYQDPYTSMNETSEYFLKNSSSLLRPMSILVSIVLFFPIFFSLFFTLPDHLFNHDLASIVLPDIDLNLSASQARSLAKNSFSRLLFKEKYRYHFRYNWPYFLIFTALYTGSTYLTSLITTTNSSLVPLLVILTPTISLLYGFYLQYFVLFNNYALTEELIPTLKKKIPVVMQNYISQAFSNPNYIHGEESLIRGPFYPKEKKEEKKEEPVFEERQEEPTGVVVDFSKKDEDDKL